MRDLDERLKEFKKFVWYHTEDAFQAKFDHCAKLNAIEVQVISDLLAGGAWRNPSTLAVRIKGLVRERPSMLHKLLQITGLTRNKIVQDIKAYARSHGLHVSTSSPLSIFGSDEGARLGSEYLAKHLTRVFQHIRSDVTAEVLEAVNQATWPGYIRQERAKRMGHEAEFRMACLLRDLDIPFDPSIKAENPLSADVTINEMSYDLVMPSIKDARVRVMATVHTANIGQYGESKDELEIMKAIQAMKRAGDRNSTTLLAFIDGVGFESNRAGLNGVLKNADEFCQFRTIWKAVAITCAYIERDITIALPHSHHSYFAAFCDRYDAELVRRDELMGDDWQEAGDALVRVR